MGATKMSPDELRAKIASLKKPQIVTPQLLATLKEVQKEVISPVRIAPVSSTANNPALSPIQIKLREVLAAKKSLANAVTSTLNIAPTNNPVAEVINTITSTLVNNSSLIGIDKSGNTISYNEEQLDFITTASHGTDCILVGAAGTGKTTCMRGAVSALIESGIVLPMKVEGHNYLQDDIMGVALVSFTRRAVSNLRKAMSNDLKGNCLTIHSLLEYQPIYSEVIDPSTGISRNTMCFEATRNRDNPLPSGIKTVIFDEASMVSVELENEVRAALGSHVQFIYLGDIQQLPPVFGSAILGYKMLELKTVELIHVYRQALKSPIIRLAHRVLSGKVIPVSEFKDWHFPNQLTIHPWKKSLSADNALITLARFLTKAIDMNQYNPEDDMVLIPYNKSCGTIELNNYIANHIARRNKLPTYEIIAGFKKLYFTVGDKVLCDKEDGIITAIEPNPTYAGLTPQKADINLDYWGTVQLGTGIDDFHNPSAIKEADPLQIDADAELDMLLSVAAGSDDEDKVRKSSHIVTVKLLDSEHEIRLDNAAKIAGLLLSYALTVHKSQGSEFRKVFFLLHNSHNTMLQRELLYTGITRAREELYIICEPDSLVKGINSQRIKGNTLAEKAEWFKGKVSTGN
jgi:exodeoxyribonuclease V alpha subunit